jgi:hypothetical protein
MHRFTWIILAAVVLAGEIPAVAQSPTQPPLTLDEISTLIRNSPPIEIRATRTFSTNVAAADIDRRWQEVANKPDHPDRRSIERLRELSRAKATSEIVLAFGGGLWYYSERKNENDNFAAAGDSDRRWMLSEVEFEPGKKSGQLTVLRAGVPFPLGSNVGMFRDVVLVELLAALCNWNIATASRLETDQTAIASSTIRYQSLDAEHFLVTRDATGRLIGVSCFSSSEPALAAWRAECRFERVESSASWTMPIASSVKVLVASGLIETFTNVQSRLLTEAELRGMIKLPSVDSAIIKTVSFDSPGKHTGPTGVWVSTSTGDKVTLSSLSESSDLVVAGRTSAGWGRWLALAIISAVVATVAVVWLRRRT